MDFSAEDISDMVILLQMIPQQGEGIGWYLLERILAIRGHSISLNAKLINLLNKLENSGYIKCRLNTESIHPRYLVTIKGKEWLESQKIKNP